MWPFSRETHQIPEERWTVASGEYEGRPMLLRINVALNAISADSRFQYQVGCAVPFHSQDERGFPSEAESQDLRAIEDALVTAFTAGGNALYTAVVTTNGMREFVFYAAKHEPVVADYERLRGSFTHEIQMAIKKDDKWQTFVALSASLPT